jgi:hypothetical protein
MQIVELDLGGNNIGDRGAVALATSLHDPRCKLTRLNLDANDIGDVGGIALGNAVGSVATCMLTSIELRFNAAVSAPAAAAIAAAIASPGCVVEALNLEGTMIGDSGLSSIASALPRSPLLRLDLRETGVTAHGILALAAALSNSTSNTFVTTLELDRNNVGDDGACALADVIMSPGVHPPLLPPTNRKQFNYHTHMHTHTHTHTRT